MVSEETIKEFQEVAETEYGVIWNESEAEEVLLGLVGYFDLLAKIDHRANQDVGGR